MEQWRYKSKTKELNDADSSSAHPKLNSLSSGKKKEKKWTFGGLLKRISKNEASENSIIRETGENHLQAASNVIQEEKNYYLENIYNIETNIINNNNNNNNNSNNKNNNNKNNNNNNNKTSLSSYDLDINLNNEKNALDSFGKNKKSRTKARIQAKRDRYCGNSSSDDQIEINNKSNSTLIRIQSEDSINGNNYKIENNRRTRAARTERYMKRLYREDVNETTDHDSLKSRTSDIQLCKNRKKYLSDTLSSSLGTKNDTPSQQSCAKLSSCYYQPYYSDQNLVNTFPGKNTAVTIDFHNNETFYNDKYTWPRSRKNKVTQINQNKSSRLDDNSNYQMKKIPPPIPPPRSSKSRLITSPIKVSIQNSHVNNNHQQNSQCYQSFRNSNNIYYNSLDRIPKKNCSTFQNNNNQVRKLAQEELKVENNNHVNEHLIVPTIKPQLLSNSHVKKEDVTMDEKLERRRHSKNLEEALLELEEIYESLRLSDENLLDRAEQRSMEEYRDRVTTTAIEGSIKSLSDTSSSYELSWRHANFDRCHEYDTRLKDDMAYRRMHQNDRPASIDPSQSSLSRVSYLATSPSLGYKDMDYLIDKPKSHRATPDLIYDDVVFRNITHANNTLKVIDPQPPFGIPLGPVTAASESDYLHVEPSSKNESGLRSLFIPKSEPDIVTDDLAYRSLRADRKNNFKDKSIHNQNFTSNNEFATISKKKRAVRSLSADLYGIIDKNSENHDWYKEYVQLNRPSKICRNVERLNDDQGTNISNDKLFFDIDNNDNRPKSMYQGRIQVCIPQQHDDDDDNNEEKNHNSSKIDKVKVNNNKHEILLSSSCGEKKNITNHESISAFSDQELSEYQQLCRDLECLIKKTSEKVKCIEKKNNIDSRKNSLSEFIEWEKLLNQNDTCLEDKKTHDASKLKTTDEINIKAEDSQACEHLQTTNKEMGDSQHDFLPSKDVENLKKINNDGNNNPNNNDNNSLNIETKLLNKYSDNFDKIIENADSVSHLDQVSTAEKIDFNDFEPINHKETKDASAVSYEASTSSLLDNNESFNNTIDSSKNNEGEKNGLAMYNALVKSMNVCFITNCLSAYYVVLWPLCLTLLLIAIIVAL